MSTRHFLSFQDLDSTELETLLGRAMELKALQRRGELPPLLRGRVVALLFDKASTRTRVSFESGIARLGGSSLFLSARDTQLGRGEPIEDTARVLSRLVDAVVIRTHAHGDVERLAAHASVPIVNALTDRFHPCQLLADLQTFVEHRGSLRGRKVVWVGDGNNVCNSFIEAAERFSFDLVVAAPAGYEPDPAVLALAPGRVEVLADVRRAARGADLLVTDVWASMGDEAEEASRRQALASYQVNEALLELAADEVLVMHCLPAHRGEEITAGVLEDPRCVVWDEAENRMHAQNALLEFLLVGPSRG